MSWIAEVHESTAEGRLKECYERIVKALGRVIPFYRVFSSSPRLLGAHLEFYGALGGPGVLSKLRREYIATAVSAENGCAHCTQLHRGFLEALGADPETFSGLAGMGDLFVTCWHRTGRNRTAGELIARGATQDEAAAEIAQTIEGLTTAPVLRDLSRRLGIEMPITEGVCEVLGGRPLLELAGDLMGRRPTDE